MDKFAGNAIPHVPNVPLSHLVQFVQMDMNLTQKLGSAQTKPHALSTRHVNNAKIKHVLSVIKRNIFTMEDVLMNVL